MADAKSSAAPPQEWDTIIRPQSGWLELRLGELWRYRDLTLLFVRRDFVAKYKQTILGPLWYLIQPLFTTIIFTVVFGNIAGISTDGLPQFLFYMAGNVIWGYFAGALTSTSSTFTSNSTIFGKVYFPRLAIPVSQLISSAIKFVIQFTFFLAFMAYFHWRGADVNPNLWVLTTPFLLLLLAAHGLGLGMIASALTAKYRDLNQLIAFGVSLAMYATPVIYPLSAVPDRYRWVVIANPLTSVVESFRYAFLGAGTVRVGHLLYSAGFAAVVVFLGLLAFNRVERTFMDTV